MLRPCFLGSSINAQAGEMCGHSLQQTLCSAQVLWIQLDFAHGVAKVSCETVPGTGEVARFPAETLGTHKGGNTEHNVTSTGSPTATPAKVSWSHLGSGATPDTYTAAL
jgi:hypothetical protein